MMLHYVAAYSTPVKNRPTQQEHSPNDLEHPSPRKQAHYTSPEKKKLTRKKLLSPETWKNNIRRKAHQSGKEYVNTKGETVPASQVKPQDCSKCRYKCSGGIDEDEREKNMLVILGNGKS